MRGGDHLINTYPEYGRCPVCTTGMLQRKKGLLAKKYECNNPGCLATFLDLKGMMKLERCYLKTEFLIKYPNPLTYREWDNIAHGGLSDHEVREKERIKEFQMRGRLLEALSRGDLDQIQKVPPNGLPIILKKGENCYLSIHLIQLHEDRKERQYVPGSRGASIRIMKGVSLRFGGYQGYSESIEVRKLIDEGTLCITDKRFIFIGGSKNIEVNLNKIIAVEVYSDGIAVSRTGKQRTEYFIGMDGELVGTLIQSLIMKLAR